MSGVKELVSEHYTGQVFETSISFPSGMSGGPVIGLGKGVDGKVFGVVMGRIDGQPGLNFAIPGRRVLEFVLPYYKKLADKSPKSYIGALNLGRIQDQLNHFPEAESAYRKALELAPESAQANRALGILFLTRNEGSKDYPRQRKDALQAIEYFNNALEIDPNDGKAHYNLLVAYLICGKEKEAQAQCNNLLDLKKKGKLPQPTLRNSSERCSWLEKPFSIKKNKNQ